MKDNTLTIIALAIAAYFIHRKATYRAPHASYSNKTAADNSAVVYDYLTVSCTKKCPKCGGHMTDKNPCSGNIYGITIGGPKLVCDDCGFVVYGPQ